jgi:hypothetical protein
MVLLKNKLDNQILIINNTKIMKNDLFLKLLHKIDILVLITFINLFNYL